MFEIWFKLEVGAETFMKVEAPNLDVARRVWDDLESCGYYMASSRP